MAQRMIQLSLRDVELDELEAYCEPARIMSDAIDLRSDQLARISMIVNVEDCEAVMDDSPYDVCPGAVTSFASLKGIRIQPGWTREVRKRVGGALGCTHLVEMLRPLATTAFQTLVASERHVARLETPVDGKPPHLLNTCYAHAETSPVVRERWPEFHVEVET